MTQGVGFPYGPACCCRLRLTGFGKPGDDATALTFPNCNPRSSWGQWQTVTPAGTATFQQIEDSYPGHTIYLISMPCSPEGGGLLSSPFLQFWDAGGGPAYTYKRTGAADGIAMTTEFDAGKGYLYAWGAPRWPYDFKWSHSGFLYHIAYTGGQLDQTGSTLGCAVLVPQSDCSRTAAGCRCPGVSAQWNRACRAIADAVLPHDFSLTIAGFTGGMLNCNGAYTLTYAAGGGAVDGWRINGTAGGSNGAGLSQGSAQFDLQTGEISVQRNDAGGSASWKYDFTTNRKCTDTITSAADWTLDTATGGQTPTISAFGG